MPRRVCVLVSDPVIISHYDADHVDACLLLCITSTDRVRGFRYSLSLHPSNLPFVLFFQLFASLVYASIQGFVVFLIPPVAFIVFTPLKQRRHRWFCMHMKSEPFFQWIIRTLPLFRVVEKSNFLTTDA